MRERATPLIMKVFAVTYPLTLMRRRATPLIMKDYPVTFTLNDKGTGITQRHPQPTSHLTNPPIIPTKNAMPRLTPLQWSLFAVLLLFYGFAVFALTRDYYLRHPPRPLAASQAAGQAPPPSSSQSTFIQREVAGMGAPAVPLTSQDPEQLNDAGDQLFGQKRYTEAIPYYRRALELDPAAVDASNDLGLALYYSGQSAGALEILRAGAERAPDFQRIWLTLGFVSAGAGDQAGARAALDKARALGPDNAIGQEAKRQLDRLSGG